MQEMGHVNDRMGREAGFYRDLFASLDNNAVLRRRNAQGVFVPVSCTREFTQMMECTAEEFIEAETREPLCTVLPEDRADTAYLLEHGIARDGQNHVTVRKRTMKGNIIWVDLHYSIFTSEGVQYAYLRLLRCDADPGKRAAHAHDLRRHHQGAQGGVQREPRGHSLQPDQGHR